MQVLAGRGGQDDPVPTHQVAESVERGSVRRAVAGDGDVARLSGHRRSDVVARALGQVGGGGSRHHVLVHTDRWNLQVRHHRSVRR